jgi:hypothetical protein
MSTAPNRVVEGYTHILGSSDYGGCIKASVARLLGYDALPTSERMQTLYDRGHEHEDECVLAMEADAWIITGRQDEAVIDCSDGWGVVIHYDGLANNGWDTKVLEIKSPSTWHSFERAVKTNTFTDPYMNRIAWQVSAQMVASGLEAVIACVEEGQVRTFGIETPIYTADEIQARVQTIREYVQAGDLPKVCSSDDWPCGWNYLHEDPPRDIDPALDELGLQRARLLADRKALDLGIKDVEEAFKSHCAGQNRKTELFTVTTYTQAGPAKWDTDLMEADGVPVDKYRVAGKPSVRTKITTRGTD